MDEDPLPTSFPAAVAWQVDGGSRPSRSSSPRPWAVGYNRICDQLNALVLCFLLILVLCIMALRFRPPPACVLPARAPGDGRGGGGVFLLVGLLSTGGNVAQRQAVRDTFALAAQASGLVDYRFVLEPGERTEAVAQEAKRWKDIIFAAETRSNYLLTKAFRVGARSWVAAWESSGLPAAGAQGCKTRKPLLRLFIRCFMGEGWAAPLL